MAHLLIERPFETYEGISLEVELKREKVTTKEAENSYFKRSIPCKGTLNRQVYHIFRTTVRTLKNTKARL